MTIKRTINAGSRFGSALLAAVVQQEPEYRYESPRLPRPEATCPRCGGRRVPRQLDGASYWICSTRPLCTGPWERSL